MIHLTRRYPISLSHLHLLRQRCTRGIWRILLKIKCVWITHSRGQELSTGPKSPQCPAIIPSSSRALPYLSAWRTTWWMWSCELFSSETTSRDLPSPLIHNHLTLPAFASTINIWVHWQTQKISSPISTGPLAILSINASLPECLRHGVGFWRNYGKIPDKWKDFIPVHIKQNSRLFGRYNIKT